jgi:membrane-bound inhibitor of C-type lysozyme
MSLQQRVNQKRTVVCSILLHAVVAIFAVGPVLAAAKAPSPPPALHIPGIKVTQQRVIYRCAGDVRVPVRYLNTDAGSFAYLPIGGKKLLFVSVQVASGVKYVAGRYSWWTKGSEAVLDDIMQEDSGEPLLKDCREVEHW